MRAVLLSTIRAFAGFATCCSTLGRDRAFSEAFWETHNKTGFVGRAEDFRLEHLASNFRDKLSLTFRFEGFQGSRLRYPLILFIFNREAVEFILNSANKGSVFCVGRH